VATLVAPHDVAVGALGVPHVAVTLLHPREVSHAPCHVGAPAKDLLSLGQ